MSTTSMTIEELKELLKDATKVKLSGCDIDGIARGKIVNKNKIFSSVPDGFGFCNVVFGWDFHDKVYDLKTKISNAENGYADIIAKIDLSTHRTIKWENDTPYFLIDFYDPKTRKPIDMCPRGVLKKVLASLGSIGFQANCGMEFEWFNFKETPDTLQQKKGVNLTPLTTGMFGYSLVRTSQNHEYFTEIYDKCLQINIPIEGIHTETGPGVYEVALNYTNALELADRAHLFKTTVKQIALNYGIMACFMAKPWNDLPGCSGHIHVSLAHLLGPNAGKNAFPSSSPPSETQTTDTMSPTMKSFLAGVLAGLPSLMAIYAPTVNSYKRLVENFWAPITVSYGFENRTAAIRLIAPPNCPPSSTRLEMRVSGADVNPYLAVAAVLGSGYHGIEKGMELPFGPLDGDAGASTGARLARNLKEAAVEMGKSGSVAREVFGDGFVDHFVLTREHEWRLWERQVTGYELSRYMEVV